MEALLELRGVSKRFGGVVALREVSLAVARGEIFGLIGPNGSGKTTLFNVVTGVVPPDAGTIRFDGVDIGGWPTHRIVRRGLARTFQNVRLFSRLTVADNVRVAQPRRDGAARAARRIEELLALVGLADRRHLLAGHLAFGEQRRLELARALATDPTLLLLDEPAAGMTYQETETLMATIRDVRAGGRTVLLIEHDMRVVMGLADRVAVLNFGEKIAEGPPEAVSRDPAVIEAYLGAAGGPGEARPVAPGDAPAPGARAARSEG